MSMSHCEVTFVDPNHRQQVYDRIKETGEGFWQAVDYFEFRKGLHFTITQKPAA